ncbi:non-ribosomal peptide synthetase [Pseudoalteromonas sp. Bsw20308]|nr:non-ribosomal peptide synthetase [Pseudoalteromonas sp. Bsw20308]
MLCLIKKIRNAHASIWVESSALKLSGTKESSDLNGLLPEIKENKERLLDLLELNGIHSKQDFRENRILKEKGGENYPVSFSQQSLLIISQYDEASSVYHIPSLFKLSPEIDFTHLMTAINIVVERHPVLKVVYQYDKNYNIQQNVLDQEIIIDSITLSESVLKPQLIKDLEQPFDLEREPSFRVKHYQSEAGQYLLLLWHHIAFDGWSVSVFFKELSKAYNALINGEMVELPILHIDYRDYAAWQRDHLQGEVLTQLQSYWQQQLAGVEPLHLYTDKARPAVQDFRGQDHSFSLDPELSMQLRALAKTQETTLYTVLLSGFYLTLSALSGQQDIVVGTPSENRHHAQTQSLVGFFVNSLALRAEIKHEQAITDFITEVHSVVSGAKVHQELPFENVVELLEVERDRARHPIYQVMFSVQGFGNALGTESSLPFEVVDDLGEGTLYSPAKFDLNLVMTDGQASISGQLNYALSLFEVHSIERLLGLYTRVLTGLVSGKYTCVGELPLLSDAERDTLLCTLNDTDKAYPQGQTLAELFSAQAHKTPASIALVCEDEELSYQTLEEASNRLAREIRADHLACHGQALSAGTLIGVYLERGVNMVVSILAILKAGGAYVPLSPEYPQSRIEYILEDTQMGLIVTESMYETQLAQWVDGEAVTLISATSAWSATHTSEALDSHSDADDLAYVIYTSGTTGQPKGVMVEHEAAAAFVFNDAYVENGRVGRVASLAPYSFDGFVFDAFYSLLQGASCYLLSKETLLDMTRFNKALRHHDIDTFFTTTALFNQMIKSGALEDTRVRNVLFGGESADINVVQQAIEEHKDTQFIHVYGPTETVVFASAYHFDGQAGDAPIGHPLDNKRFYVLDEQGALAPMGSPGELYIGGAGLARGYLNRPELTAQCFIANPFASEADKAKGYTRLYKTGDIVRWLPSGELVYISRNDNQVKIRGHRIELGEVESVVSALPGVQQAAVIVQSQAQSQYLAAYVVAQAGESLSITQLQAQLRQQLPDYMLPSSVMEIAGIPLTVNGKLDKAALPEPILVDKSQYVGPRNELEAGLCEVWQTVLELEQVGIYDNFFQIGGNSIMAIKLTQVSRRTLGIDISLTQLFEHKTVAGLAQNLSDEPLIVIPKTTLTQVPLSFAQERLLFIEQYSAGSDAYHIPMVVKLAPEVQLENLETAFNLLLDRHPILKTVYRHDEQDNAYQTPITESLLLTWQQLASDEVLHATLKTQMSTPFDLTSQLSLQLHGYEVSGQRYLLIMWHHIAFDGWSLDIFIQELAQCYQALCQGDVVALPEQDIVYADYAAWQRDHLQGEVLTQLQSYWQQQLAGVEPLHLYTDKARPAVQDFRGQDHSFSLDPELSMQLRALAKTQETTLYTVLLSGFYLTLSALSGQQDIVVGTPSENRHHAQTQSLVGFFVNSLALRAEIKHEQAITDFITEVHSVVSGAKVHQELPFENVVELLEVERDRARHPIYQVMFSVQGFGNALGTESSLPFEVVDDLGEDTLYSPAKFDLNLVMTDGQASISGQLNYALSLFEVHSIERLLGLYTRVLTGLVSGKYTCVGELPLLSDAERDTLLCTLNDTDKAYPQGQTLAELFSAQAHKTPASIALVCEDEELSYQTLEEASNRLAREIRADHLACHGQALSAGTLIGVYLERGVNMVVSILAILKAGGAYVPLSPEYPQSRIEYILEDTQMGLIVTESMYETQLAQWVDGEAVTLISATSAWSATHTSEALDSHSDADDLAYVIYTSGTTGQPKGVMVEHEAAAAFVFNDAYVENGRVGRVASLAPYSFDGFVFDAFYSLLQGASCYLLSKETLLDMTRFNKALRHHDIDTFFTTTALFNQMIKSGALENTRVRNVLFGGESADINVVQQAIEEHKDTQFIHVYGPTETVVFASAYHFDGQAGDAPIGHPLDNKRFYVLDEQGALAPMGSPGELYIGGAGLARGYLNRPELTAQCFIANPFASEADKAKGYTRLYKTGDIVRWLPSGELVYISRNDNQVKIRGHRIELGEVESVVSALPGVQQAAVIVQSQAQSQYLAAYVVAQAGESLSITQLQAQLRQQLPDYMLPSSVMEIAGIPLTVNGKLDKAALPEPILVDKSQYVGPRNELEAGLCEVWQTVLELEQVGIYDNFFQIGGNSITAIRIVSACKKMLGVELSVGILFEHKTIEQLYRYLNEQNGFEVKPNKLSKQFLSTKHGLLDLRDRYLIEALDIKDSEQIFPVTPTQRDWLLHTYTHSGDEAWWVNTLFKVQPAIAEKSSNNGLLDAWIHIVKSIPALRSKFHIENDRVYQLVNNEANLEYHEIDVHDLDEVNEIIKKRMSDSIDISRSSLLRIFVFSTSNGEQYHAFIIHHAIVDGWNLSNIIINAYNTLLGFPQPNEKEGNSGIDYVRWQLSLDQEVAHDFWSNELRSLEDSTPFYSGQGYIKRDRNSVCQPAFSLGVKHSQMIYKSARNLSITPYILIEAAWARTLSQLLNRNTVYFSIIDSGRSINLSNLDTLVFNTIAVLPVKVDLIEDGVTEGFVRRLHKNMLKRQEHSYIDISKVHKDYRKSGFSSLIIYQNNELLTAANQGESSEQESLIECIDKYDPCPYKISLVINPNENLSGFFEYFNTDIKEEDFYKIKTTFQNELKQLAERLSEVNK